MKQSIEEVTCLNVLLKLAIYKNYQKDQPPLDSIVWDCVGNGQRRLLTLTLANHSTSMVEMKYCGCKQLRPIAIHLAAIVVGI